MLFLAEELMNLPSEMCRVLAWAATGTNVTTGNGEALLGRRGDM